MRTRVRRVREFLVCQSSDARWTRWINKNTVKRTVGDTKTKPECPHALTNPLQNTAHPGPIIMATCGLTIPHETAALHRLLLLLVFLCSPGATLAAPCGICNNSSTIMFSILDSKTLSLPGYPQVKSCESLLKQIWVVSSLQECQRLQSYSILYCGCPPIFKKDSCSLCPGDDKNNNTAVQFHTDRTVRWWKNSTIFAGDVPTCGLIQAFAATLSSNDPTCSYLQETTSVYCGCPALPNYCRFCDGKPLTQDYKDQELPFLTNTELGIQGTCELYYEKQYRISEDASVCQGEIPWRVYHCGCDNGVLRYFGAQSVSDQIAFVWIQRSSAILSLLGSVSILYYALCSKQRRCLVYHQFMALVAAFDLNTSIVLLIGPLAINRWDNSIGLSWGIYGAMGNKGSCTAQGFFFHTGLTSIYLMVSLTVYHYLIIIRGYGQDRLKRLRPYLFGVPIALGLFLAFVTIPFIGVGWTFCIFNRFPDSVALWVTGIFLLLPILTSIVTIPVLLGISYAKVRSLLPPSQRKSWTRCFQSSSANRSNQSRIHLLEQDLYWQSLLYAISYGMSWPILGVGILLGEDQDLSKWFWMVLLVLLPLSGFTNAVIYFRSKLFVGGRRYCLRDLWIQCRHRGGRNELDQQLQGDRLDSPPPVTPGSRASNWTRRMFRQSDPIKSSNRLDGGTNDQRLCVSSPGRLQQEGFGSNQEPSFHEMAVQ